MKRGIKLWQKIFLVTLALVVIAINLTSALLIRNSHQLLVEREKENAISEHEYLIAAVLNNVAYEQLKQNIFQLPQDELLKIFENTLGSQSHRGISVYQNGERIQSIKSDSVQIEKDLLNKAASSNKYYINIVEQDQKTHMLIASLEKIQNQNYIVISTFDVTSIYQLHEQQMNRVKWISVFCAIVIAVILLIVIHTLLFPLQKVTDGMKKIAQGIYNQKVCVKSSDELAELSENMNTMADAIQANVTSLERVAENRKLFIDNLTHEMKTPLTSILGYADILRIKFEVSDEERQEYAGVIVEESKRLRALSGKLMELVTLGNTKTNDFQTIQLPDLFTEIKMTLHPIFDSQHLVLDCKAENIAVFADIELFKSMLYNLLDNAMKASSAGNLIRLSGIVQEGCKMISVQDYGIGIPQTEISRIVEPFYMVDKTRARKAGGAGLGLALCAEIARLHRAEMKIESEQGKGTIVKIVFREETGNEES